MEKEKQHPLDARVDELEKELGCRSCAAEKVFGGKADNHNHPPQWLKEINPLPPRSVEYVTAPLIKR